MKDSLLLALVVAVSSGMGMAVLGTLNSASGRHVGAFGTGLLVNILAGLIAAAVLLAVRAYLPQVNGASLQLAAPMLAVSALIGIGTLSGISFSLARIGVAAGLAAIILGQMILAVIIDATGWLGTERLPLSLARGIGLALLALATWLLLPPAPEQ